MKHVLGVLKTLSMLLVVLGLVACASSNEGYRGGDHRGGGPSGAYGLQETQTTSSKEYQDAKQGSSKQSPIKQGSMKQEDSEAVYTGGDHRGGGPHGPLG